MPAGRGRRRSGWPARRRTVLPRPAGSQAALRSGGRARCDARWRLSPRQRSGRYRHRRPAPRRASGPRSRGSRIRSRRRGRGRRPARRDRPATRRAARQSRVVGCRPVPNAIPGSRARTTSSGARRCRRHVGRITSRRPIRMTGKCAFHASAQSASWTSRVVSSPIGRSPNAWRWPRASDASATARADAASSRAGK